MQIEIVAVGREEGTGKNGKPYSSLSVAYKSGGKLSEKKLMSFSNPAVFKAMEKAKAGDTFNVKTEKDNNGYWQWTGFEAEVPVSEAKEPPRSSGNTGVSYQGRDFETKEERALKQKYIVRQSSLTTAIEILSVGAKTLDKQAVITLAEELEQWVFRSDSLTGTEALIDMEDDIPY